MEEFETNLVEFSVSELSGAIKRQIEDSFGRVRVRGAAPPLGPSRGGTRVAGVGGGFRDAYTLRCAFGASSAPVLARYVDDSQLECSSPVHASGSVGVRLSMNGQQYAPSGV
ncbi:MAG: IPT/TIG domain-containing protein, partial [Pseudomonadota bacterium]|nr:IPT/TIG domain-containing protein [Pseudomonadota bacterium]